MVGRFAKGITAGAVIGIAAGVLIMPQMDRGTKRRLRKTGKMVKSTAEDVYDGMRSFIK